MKKLLLLALLFVGCAEVQSNNSGFLPDYAVLAQDPGDPDVERWLSPDAGYYGRLMVPPLVAYFHENVHGRPICANELDDLLTRLRGAVIDALDDEYLLATEPGPGVLRLEIAVTDLHKQSDAFSGLGLRDANVEMRGVDSQTGEVVFAAIYSRRLTRSTGDDKEAAVRAVATDWVAHVREEIDAAEAE